MPYSYRTGEIFSDRQVGLTNNPGQTGGQEDFGSEKGSTALTLKKPEWISYMRQNLVDIFRYHHYFEADGTMLLYINHPNWRTWNGETHDAATGDTLGKTKWAARPIGNGWRSFDNEHRSQNNIISFYALTGDYMVRDEFMHMLSVDMAQHKNRPGAERAVGRLMLAWSKLSKVMPPAYGNMFKSLCEEKYKSVIAQWPSRNFKNDPTRTVRVSQIILDPRSEIFDPTTGQLTQSWIPYQTAMMALGAYSHYKVAPSQELLEFLQDVCRSVVMHGCFKENNAWHCLTFCRYLTGADEGKPMPDTSYFIGSREINPNNSFWSWTAPAFVVAKQIFDPSSDVWQRADEVLTHLYKDGYNSWLDSEWLACGNP
jgi:hypothetical protein